MSKSNHWTVVVESTCSAAWYNIMAGDDVVFEGQVFAINEINEAVTYHEEPTHFVNKVDHEAVKSRALLASAAPEILEALEAITSQFSWMDGPEGWREVCDKANAAIAKAKGVES